LSIPNSKDRVFSYPKQKAANDLVFYYPIKRILDVIFGVFGMLLLLFFTIVFIPFYLFGQNKGPIFFRQKRIGRYGEEFYIYKFRSMIINAEEKLRKDKQLYQKYLKNNYKLVPNEDPRVTKFGKFIRRTSLDEIPQFINVLKGEMSIVGPRPIVYEELEEYKDRKTDFLSVKPGLTGYWQVCGRSEVGYPERVDIELYYVYNKSFLFDLKIILKTIFRVILRKGAY